MESMDGNGPSSAQAYGSSWVDVLDDMYASTRIDRGTYYRPRAEIVARMNLTSKILSLPTEILSRIIYHAIPEDASVLDSDSFRLCASTIDLECVCHRFRTSVLREYCRGRPLKIHLFNTELHLALTEDPTRRPIPANFNDLYHTIVNHARRHDIRMNNLKQIPFYRFRKIEIHLIPQLSKLNVPADLLDTFFPDMVNQAGFRRGFFEHDRDEAPAYEGILHAMKQSVLTDATEIGKHLHQQFFKHRAMRGVIDAKALDRGPYAVGQTRIRILCHDTADELSEYDLRQQYQLNPLPGEWSMYLPRDLNIVFDGPRTAILEPEEMWTLLRSFSWIRRMRGGCSACTLFEAVKLPSFLIQHHGTTRSPAEWHAHLRQKAIFTWEASSSLFTKFSQTQTSLESRWLGIDSERKLRQPAELFFRNLSRMMIPASQLLYSTHVQDCETNCSHCTAKEFLLTDDGITESDDAFEVEAPDSQSMTSINILFEQHLYGVLFQWPQRFALEQQALFLRLTDVQTQFLLQKHRKYGRGVIEGVKQLLQEWNRVKQRCRTIAAFSERQSPYLEQLDQSTFLGRRDQSTFFEKLDIESGRLALIASSATLKARDQLWKEMSVLPGYMRSAQLLRRLRWCRYEVFCQHWNHWGEAAERIGARVDNYMVVAHHPAVLVRDVLTI